MAKNADPATRTEGSVNTADPANPQLNNAMTENTPRHVAYNNFHGTDYTPDTYDEDRKCVPLVIAWDEGWEQSEIARNYEERYFAARDILSRIVTQYDAAPDGPLGKGFTNEPFLAARTFLSSPAQIKPRPMAV